MDIGSCWKNNGQPCDGDVTTDVTRYSEMIINPNIDSWTDKDNYPYGAYHIYCSPGNAESAEEPYNFCDSYNNPQRQDILQILPHPAWGQYRYPTKKGEGWLGVKRTWELDVGRLSQSLYFYQDPGTEPVERHWPSIDLGTEIYMSGNQVAEWTVSDFDIIIPRDDN
ncbi:hypothetical protein HYC85_028781 [Camellia sinensis]|uniref:DUF7705 domain-containing protein n=1 Tax=Camellia sinensis TaxID=4442 RepID=A0A7J7FW27_CAMSI|nr:hypothetical protein HYC85_028781 [Camellia sinensis]